MLLAVERWSLTGDGLLLHYCQRLADLLDVDLLAWHYLRMRDNIRPSEALVVHWPLGRIRRRCNLLSGDVVRDHVQSVAQYLAVDGLVLIECLVLFLEDRLVQLVGVFLHRLQTLQLRMSDIAPFDREDGPVRVMLTLHGVCVSGNFFVSRVDHGRGVTFFIIRLII